MRTPPVFRPLGLALMAVAATGVLLQIGPASASSEKANRSTTATKRQVLAAYAKLPLAFVPNVGQLDRRVRYAAQAGGSSFFFTRTEAVLALRKGKRGVALRLGFLGANPAPAIAGARPGTGRVNYLLGSDPARWHTNLPTYGEIVYRDLWPGADLRLRGQSGTLKYEFRLAPGADVSRIRLGYRGQQRLSLGRSGELRIETALGLLRDARPVSYQQIGGRRVAVKSRFALGRGGAYGFTVGAYDRRYPLVIDPGLAYSTFLGGSGPDQGVGIAIDGAGSAYLTGTTGSDNFPTTAGAFDTTYNSGGGDAFVTKLDASGAALGYSTYLGGSDDDGTSALALDGAGNAYVTGHTASADFPTTAGAFDTSFNGSVDAFVTKLDASGAALGYSTYLGGSGYDGASGIELDGAGSAYLSGATDGTDFPTTAGAFDTTYNGLGDAFVTKLDASGAALGYSTYLGGSGTDGGHSIAVDGAGGAYLTGNTQSYEDFPTTAGAFDTTWNGGTDSFVTKLDASGAALGYSSYLGGSDYDLGQGIAVDGAGNAYLTGYTGSPSFPTTAGAFDRTYNDGGDAFVTKVDASGAALGYSSYLGGSQLRPRRSASRSTAPAVPT